MATTPAPAVRILAVGIKERTVLRIGEAGAQVVKTIKLSRASRPLTSYAAEEVVVLTERNRPVAAVVPLKGIDRESLGLSSHPEFLGLIGKSRAQFHRGETLTLE